MKAQNGLQVSQLMKSGDTTTATYLYQLVDHRNLINILLCKINATFSFLEIQLYIAKVTEIGIQVAHSGTLLE